MARTSQSAVWSLVTGILSLLGFVFLTGIPAIILAFVAFSKIRGSGGAIGGKGLAISGLITGILGTLAGIFMIIAFAAMVPVLGNAKEKAEEAQLANQARQLSFALQAYSLENGEPPASLDELHPDYVSSEDILTMEHPETGRPLPFLFRPEAVDSTEAGVAVLLAPAPIGSRRVVAYADGTVEALDEPVDPELLSLFGEE